METRNPRALAFFACDVNRTQHQSSVRCGIACRLVCRTVCVFLHEFVFLLFFPSFHTLSPMMMIVGLILYLLRARGGIPTRVLRGGGGRRAPICLGSRASLAPPPRLKKKISLTREKMRTVGPLSSRIVARARPLVSYARTPVPTVPKGSRRPSSAHRFFAGFKDEGLRRRPLLGHDHCARAVRGRRGAERVRPAVPRAAGVAQHGLGRGPASPLRRVCAVGSGERGRTRRGYRQRAFWRRTTSTPMRGSAEARRRAGGRVRSRARVPARLWSGKHDRRSGCRR